MAVVDEVVEEKMSSEEGLPEQRKDDEVGDIKLPFPVLPESPRPNFIQYVNLKHLQNQHQN